MSLAAGVVVDKEFEYIMAPTGLRAVDGRPQGRAWVGVIPNSSLWQHTYSCFLYYPFGKGPGQHKLVH